jgi:hypothetical protein
VFDPLKRVLLEMARVGDLSVLLPWLASRLVESCESATASAIWEVGSKEMCTANSDPDACASGDDCLHLSTLATRAARGTIVTSNPDLERAFRRLPLTALDSEFDMPIPKPLGVEDNRRWFPLRLVHRQKLVGAMAVFFRDGNDPSTVEMLQLIANQLASDITSERACEAVRRLQQQLDGSQGMPRPAPGTAVVSEADIRRFERSNIAAALEATGGRVYGRGGAAELLGLKPTTLASRLKKLGLTSRP